MKHSVSVVLAFAKGFAVCWILKEPKENPGRAEESHELFVGQSFRVIQPTGPGPKDYTDYSLRVVRIHHTKQPRTREDDKFLAKIFVAGDWSSSTTPKRAG